MEYPENLRKELLDIRQNPELAAARKTKILEVVQAEAIEERTRAIAMAIIADHQWLEGLPLAKKIVIESPGYSGLQQAAIRAVGVLGQDKYDLAFLDDLLDGLQKMNAKNSLGVLRNLAETLSKARSVLAKKLSYKDDVAYSNRSGSCCPPDHQNGWRNQAIRGSAFLEETLVRMKEFLEDKKCKGTLNEVFMLLAQVHLLQGFDRQGKYTQEEAQKEYLKVTRRTLQVIDDCGPKE